LRAVLLAAGAAAFALALPACWEGTNTETERAGPATTQSEEPVGTTTEVVTVTAPQVTVTEAPATNELPPRKTVACGMRRFRVLFDPERGVLVMSKGRVIASAGADAWSTARMCPATRPTLKRSSDEGPPGVYEAVAVDCAAPRPVEIDVHPVTTSGGRLFGSNLVVYLPRSPTWLVAAAFVDDPAGRRIYYNRRLCATG
jgi:hypothetical protein